MSSKSKPISRNKYAEKIKLYTQLIDIEKQIHMLYKSKFGASLLTNIVTEALKNYCNKIAPTFAEELSKAEDRDEYIDILVNYINEVEDLGKIYVKMWGEIVEEHLQDVD